MLFIIHFIQIILAGFINIITTPGPVIEKSDTLSIDRAGRLEEKTESQKAGKTESLNN
jgi:hypothetical protein